MKSNEILSRTINLYFLTFMSLMVGFAVIGAFIHYSPVPFHDMWGRYFQVVDGNVRPWLAQFNAHRIPLPALLYWIDLKWFKGVSIFLIFLNYLLVCASSFIFIRFLEELLVGVKSNNARRILECILVAWLFLWVQRENFVIGFQVAFFLAQVFPLCTFYLMYQTSLRKDGRFMFFLTCCFGILSMGTMVNAVLTLPLLLFYSILIRDSKERRAILLVLSIATISLYFYKYNHSRANIRLVIETPLQYIRYLLLILGKPLGSLFSPIGIERLVSGCAGAIFVILFSKQSFRILSQPKKSSLEISVFIFLFFIFLTTCLATLGASKSVPALWVPLRYSTLSIMGWAALLLLYSQVLVIRIINRDKFLFSILGALTLLMLYSQKNAILPHQLLLFKKDMAALALELGIKDDANISIVSGDSEWALGHAAIRSKQKLSVFNLYPWVSDKDNLGKTYLDLPMKNCQGQLELVESMEGEKQYLKIIGWMYNADGNKQLKLIRVLNDQNRIVGYGLTGMPRKDIKKEFGKKAQYAGFQGYVLSEYNHQKLMLVGDHDTCQMPIVMKGLI